MTSRSARNRRTFQLESLGQRIAPSGLMGVAHPAALVRSAHVRHLEARETASQENTPKDLANDSKDTSISESKDASPNDPKDS